MIFDAPASLHAWVNRVRPSFNVTIFNERALFNIRKEKYRPTDPATCFENIRGGLSKYTLSDYKKAINELKLQILIFETNYQFKYKLNGILYPISRFVTNLPIIGEFLTFSSFAVLTSEV